MYLDFGELILILNMTWMSIYYPEVLTRVMRLGLESDSSHYFCDLWLDLDLQRNDLRLDLDLQRNDLRLDLDLQRNDLRLDLDLQGNDLLPMQVKSYSSDPGTSYIFKIALGQKGVFQVHPPT